ncbi:hypothetical protein ABE902_16850 [Enterococcus casseliflavus]|uniref:hypothetical protein n=1 Tax=Enterococcus TaxID=1350 RepID=UPI002A77B17D|nr:hypothetical protein [Enterococcus casseliflavus]
MFDFREYYEISRSIEETPDLFKTESYRRTGISRAYYSCYKICDEFVSTNYSNYNGFEGKSSHRSLWLFFSVEKELKKLEINEPATRLLELRQKSDYKAQAKMTKTDLKLANREAKKIIDKIQDAYNLKSEA